MAIRTITYAVPDSTHDVEFIFDEDEYMEKMVCCGLQKEYSSFEKKWLCQKRCGKNE